MQDDTGTPHLANQWSQVNIVTPALCPDGVRGSAPEYQQIHQPYGKSYGRYNGNSDIGGDAGWLPNFQQLHISLQRDPLADVIGNADMNVDCVVQ